MSTIEAAAVRPGDDFDAAAVHAWLAERIPEAADAPGPPEVRQFSGGASNLTYLLRYPGEVASGAARHPERDLILRRPPVGRKAASAHDMHREFLVQSRLAGAFPYVPEMLAFCDDQRVIGSDFYVMEKLDGIILRSRPPRGLELTPARTRDLCTSVVDRLVDLHTVDPVAARLDDLGRGTGYVERQVSGWSERYRAARTPAAPRFERVMSWLEENRPADVANVVIHNDYRFDNVVLDPLDLSVVGVLDWEMATLGDPLMDLGASLAYWVEAGDDRLMQAFRRQPTHLPGMLTRREVVDRYLERTGRSVDDWRFYEVYGLFRLAVIIQQIHAREVNKPRADRNPAFRRFWLGVRYLSSRCGRIIRKGAV